MLNRRLTFLLLAVLFLPFIFFSLARIKQRPTADSFSPSPIDGSSHPSGKPPDTPAPHADDNEGSWSSKLSNLSPFGKDNGDDSIVSAVKNETLGFGAILMISLESRTDRRDAVSLIGSTTGVRITKIIDAVRGETISDKAKPAGQAKEKLPKEYLGSWRSHMDAFRYIVDNRIETALLLEDDIDWDIHVKSQLTSFSRALRSSPLRPPLSEDERRRAPYGLDWDVLHLGTSRNAMAPSPYGNLFQKYPDTYSPPFSSLEGSQKPCAPDAFYCWYDIMHRSKVEEKERVIFPSYQPVGLVAIGVSLRGAQKMLYELSWKALDTSMDFGVRDALMAGRLQGWSVTPPIMSSWSTGGAGDSDLRNNGKGPLNPKEMGNLNGKSKGLYWSARKELTKVLGSDRYWQKGAKWYNTGAGSGGGPPIPDRTGNGKSEEEVKKEVEAEKLEEQKKGEVKQEWEVAAEKKKLEEEKKKQEEQKPEVEAKKEEEGKKEHEVKNEDDLKKEDEVKKEEAVNPSRRMKRTPSVRRRSITLSARRVSLNRWLVS